MTNRRNEEKVVWNQVAVPKTNVTVYEALHHRRMAWKFQDKAVPRDALERMLNAAVWAPNHRLNEPWRFVVVDKDEPLRTRLADHIYDKLFEQWGDARRAEPYRQKVLTPPALMYGFYLANDDWFVEKENYAAVICSLYALGLAGHAEGLSVTFDTGQVTRVDGLKEVLGAEENWHVLAMLSIGYPGDESASSRTPVQHFVRWS